MIGVYNYKICYFMKNENEIWTITVIWDCHIFKTSFIYRPWRKNAIIVWTLDFRFLFESVLFEFFQWYFPS